MKDSFNHQVFKKNLDKRIKENEMEMQGQPPKKIESDRESLDANQNKKPVPAERKQIKVP